MLQLVRQYSSSMQFKDIAAAYYRLGVLCKANSALAQAPATTELLHALDQLLPSVQQRLPARHLSNIIWGCAYAQHVPVMQALLPLFLQPSPLGEANAVDISNVVWAVAERELQLGSQQLAGLLTAYSKQVDTAIPQGMSNVLAGVAKMQQQVPDDQLQLLVTAFLEQ